jgi:glucan phosphoethanolaminetransferase (alkaline phosphatase superfamily)
MKKSFILLVFFILILAIFVLSRQPAGYRQVLEERDRVLGSRIDSLRAIISVQAQRDTVLRKELDSLKAGLTEAQNTANTWKQRYDRQKRNYRPIPDPVLDSLIDSYR